MRAHWRRWLAGGLGLLAVLLGVTVIAAPRAGGGAPDKPAQLAVNLGRAPMAVPAGQGIRFSWAARDARRGETQHGYQLRVAASPARLFDGTAVWDTGTVASGSPDVAYAGPALAAGTRYWWTVRTFDDQGRASEWAAAVQFGTALGPAWDALPVWAGRAPGAQPSGWAFLRGSVQVKRKPVIAATVYATAGSTEPARQYVFRLSLNGTVLGVGPVRPPNPQTQNEYSAWDVTKAIKGGTDTFGALAYTSSNRRFQLELVIEYADGQRQVWGTGKGWQGMDGGAVYPEAGSISQLYYNAPVENLDAEHYPFGFDTPGFRPAAADGWRTVARAAPLPGLTPTPAANLQLAAHKPVKVTALGGGRYLLDFGVTQVGGLRLTLDGTAGQQVRIQSGEVLSGPGRVQYKLSAGPVYDDTWTLRAGPQTLQYWGYRVFRYVEVTGAPQPLTAANTAALAFVYPGQPGASAMSSSSAPLNEAWQFTKDSVEALNLVPYLDSPTRERSGGYEGDDYIHQQAQAAVDGDSSAAAYSLEYAATFMLLDTGATALREGNTPFIEFQELAPVTALAQWQQTGDPAVLTSVYQQLKQLLPARYLGADGLVTMTPNPFGAAHLIPGEPAQLVDWPASERDGFVFTRENTVVNAFAYAGYAAMAQIAGVVGDSAGARDDAATAARIAAAMRAKLYDPATGAFRDGVGTSHEAVQSSADAVALGVATPAEAKTAAAYLAARGMACSVYCAAYLLEALYDGGQPQAALRLMSSAGTDSWLHMIAQGAGSTMEAWTPAAKPSITYSHAWGTAPAYIVPQYLFGVQPLAPGWSQVLIRPQPASLTRGSVTVPTPRGPVSVSFASGGGRFAATVDVPATATAEVVLPGVRAGQRVLVDDDLVTARALPAADGLPGGLAAGAAAVRVAPGWHLVSTAP
jgi:Bacterial alpha-L-rhamnosidase 6 hairpin glycosidase domain/Bacterial alpha-L-rhamnosidase C-terminal domain/Bacterial alpha-L-rhamnosidase concanavalin-like domain